MVGVFYRGGKFPRSRLSGCLEPRIRSGDIFRERSVVEVSARRLRRSDWSDEPVQVNARHDGRRRVPASPANSCKFVIYDRGRVVD